jgi:hypothetical protein
MLIPTELSKVVPRLPVELWLLIFRFATSTPISTSADYEPFQPCYETTAVLSNAALRDKCTLTLVCKQWRLLATDLLYEDIRIGDGIAALHASLRDTPITGDPAPGVPHHRVRRAVLPYTSTSTPTHPPPPALALLARLPHLEVLVRPHPYNHNYHHRRRRRPAPLCFEFPTSTPALPALRRLEWAFDPTGDAARAGGINALPDVLRAAPALHDLVLLGPMPPTALRQHRTPLRALRTLRLHAGAAACPLIARQVTYWALPALENVVLRGAARAQALEALWEAVGAQVRVLEVDVGGGEGVPVPDVGRIVGACAALEELNVRVGAEDLVVGSGRWDPPGAVDADSGGVSRTWACAHDTLQRVGIYVDAGEWTVKTWTAVVEYVAQFGKGCPALRCVVLYVRDVAVVAQDPQFHVLHETLLSSGRQLLLRSVHV